MAKVYNEFIHFTPFPACTIKLKNNLAPIVLFAYDRPDHTQKVINSLLRNEEAKDSELIIFSDGPRTQEAIKSVRSLRGYLHSVKGFKSIKINESSINLGLARSVIGGVTSVFESYESAIILEDDLLVSENFLCFMNAALDRYSKNENVISIHGYVYPIHDALPNNFFLRGADCWGWATWRRGWNLFNPNAKELLNRISTNNLQNKFDFNGTFNYSGMLKSQVMGQIDSWAILWYTSAFLENRLTLYPGYSLIKNIGNDGSGTHGESSARYNIDLSNSKYIGLEDIPVVESAEARISFESFFRSLNANKAKKIHNFIVKKINTDVNFRTLKKMLPRWLKDMLMLSYSFRVTKDYYFGKYETYLEAKQFASGYDDERILKKAIYAAQLVSENKVLFERDGFLFHKYFYSNPIQIVLSMIGGSQKNYLNVVDYGGSLGSSYFQYQPLLHFFKKVSWRIIEQEKICRASLDIFKGGDLRFYSSLNECITDCNPNIDLMLFSSSLQYLEDPLSILSGASAVNSRYLVLDRISVSNDERDWVTIQYVRSTYKASYPVWIFSERALLQSLSKVWRLLYSENSLENQIEFYKGRKIQLKGYIFEKIG